MLLALKRPHDRNYMFMIKKILLYSFVIIATLFSHSIYAADLVVNNRVLARVNGKVFSVIDLMKKMELIFYREFPQYADAPEAKYQFFTTNWRMILDEIIDAELIVANAKDVKLEVSDGDVRQEIERIFGPDVVVNIDKLGMTYDEAFKMLHNDLTVQRMTYGMAHVHALNKVGPQEIRKAWETYNREHPIEEAWDYQVISIRSSNSLEGRAIADMCYKMLSEKEASLDNLQKLLKEKKILTPNTTVTISEAFHRTNKSLSEIHREVLMTMKPGSYSAPTLQGSKGSQKQGVLRIFYVDKYTPQGITPLKDVENKIKNYLLDKAVQDETLAYRKRLRKRFGIDEEYLKHTIPENFTPFSPPRASL